MNRRPMHTYNAQLASIYPSRRFFLSYYRRGHGRGGQFQYDEGRYRRTRARIMAGDRAVFNAGFMRDTLLNAASRIQALARGVGVRNANRRRLQARAVVRRQLGRQRRIPGVIARNILSFL